MRPTLARSLACLAVLAAIAPPGTPAVAQGNGQPPHAWLFGTWTGGLFPAPSNVNTTACLAQPVVIFTRDVVMRATLTDVTYTQRVVETARTDARGTDFKFASSEPASRAGAMLGVTAPQPLVGFGCESLDVLHVQRRGENEIAFPGCADFPNPLVRCH